MLSRIGLTAAAIAVVVGSNSTQAQQQAKFSDATSESGLSLANAAACWADLDRDGWPDLCAGGVVWRNESGARFSQLADGVGSVVAGDFNNDGWPDLFSYTALQVLLNQNGKSFEKLALPEIPRCSSRGAALGDFNGDGFLDIYVGGYEDWNAGVTFPDLLLLNVNGAAFELALADARYRCRGVSACDFDRDGDLDIYASNYRLQPNVLWVNDGEARLTDRASALNAVSASPGFSGGHTIGSAWGDFNADGEFDLFVGNFAHVDSRGDQPKSRFLQNVPGKETRAFENRGACGVFYQESYASPAVADYDNDGDLDLYLTTVYGTASFGRPNHPVLFRNEGEFEFVDRNTDAALPELPPTYQAAWADFDRDGDLDLASAGRLFRNQAEGRHWLGLRLFGDGELVNHSAIGAQVRIRLGAQVLTRQVEAGSGEGNQNALMLHFGLGDHNRPVQLEITWPGGARQVVSDVAIDQHHAIVRQSAP